VDKPLVIVESPTKVKTIKKYLGNDFNVTSTMGHIKDLPKKEIGIDINNGFCPQYIIITGKNKIIQELKKAAGNAQEIFLAPDPDREGEAIAWHTSEILSKKNRSFYRVMFHELTKNAILNAMNTPEPLNKNKYEAQQARRILDRLVGYQISPLLWRKVKRGLSAGRVQSVAVRIIVDRERLIQAFESEEYWTITAAMTAEEPPPFDAKLSKKNGQKIHIPNKESSDQILKDLENEKFIVHDIKSKTSKRNPSPPFITSTLQQDAIKKLRFSAKKTMMIAQQLYEGIDINGEPVGLITYMRTDSTRIANEAAEEAIQFVKERFNPSFSIEKPRIFKNKKKVQDAHEAIRPTSAYYVPDEIKKHLSPEQYALYRLIWQRFVASQMHHALIDTVSISIAAKEYLFQASGSIVQFQGFMAVYTTEEDDEVNDKNKIKLPALKKGETIECQKLSPKQHFTQPPPRFTEASLVKELEENGIGRPSTYATIISTIQEKNYVEKLKGYFHPTEIGCIVNDLLRDNFPDIMDVEFTAKMEDSLDRIETAQMNIQEILTAFYDSFKQQLDDAGQSMLSMKGIGLMTEIVCPDCKKEKLHIKYGKNGLFLACNGYPDCSFSCNYVRDEKGNVMAVEPETPQVTEKTCDKCGKPLLVKNGKYGTFLACSGYPDCKFTMSLNELKKPVSTGVSCPNEKCDGEILEKTTRRGKTFYGCSMYPKCEYALWYKPISKQCPECQAPFIIEKITKKKGKFETCVNKDCKYELSIDEATMQN